MFLNAFRIVCRSYLHHFGVNIHDSSVNWTPIWCSHSCKNLHFFGVTVTPRFCCRVAVRQLFSFIAVAASEIVTVMSSNSSFISFWRSFRQIVWEVLWTLKLTQSQVGIVGLKIVNSLNRINRCVKFRKRNRLLVTFVVFFTALWTFWQLIL